MLAENTFWHYAVDIYGQEGITDVCLKLQDELGLNVNLLLLLCYAEQQQQRLSSEQIGLLSQGVARWHQDYTKPLRQIRRRLALEEAATVTTKRAIFDAEMALEKAEQRLLLATFNHLNPAHCVTPHNLQRYLASADKSAPIRYGELLALLQQLL